MLFHLNPGFVRSSRIELQPVIWKHGITVHLVRHPRARRYLLRLCAMDAARLVIPRGGNRDEALRFLERSEPWLLRQRTKWQSHRPARQIWIEGTRFLFRGEEIVLRVEKRDDGVRLGFGDQIITLPGALSDYREPVRRHLRRLAERELPERTRELAREYGIPVYRVTIRAQKTRWGSCSIRGTISLNWRLIQAPLYVRDYLIIHELMHRREMNHSTRYWKHVANACPTYRDAELWLKKNRLGHE